MRKRTIPSLATLIIILTSGVCRADGAAASISNMVLGLQQLQVAISKGDKAAYADQRRQLKAVGEAIDQAGRDVWTSKTERVSAVVYLLSGGLPKPFLKLVDADVFPKDEQNLARGTLAYVIGREKEALDLLQNIEPRTLDLRLGGQVAFMLSVLLTRVDQKKSIEYLDLARLLSPGSLVEEAALRREILLAGDQRSSDRVAFLARQYVSRFGLSIYADDFVRNFAVTVTRLGLLDNLEQFNNFQPLVHAMTGSSRRAFLLSVARSELISGNMAVVGASLSVVVPDVDEDGADAVRRRLYLGVTNVFNGSYEAGVATLNGLSPSQLPVEDRPLWAVAKSAAAHLHEMPEIPAKYIAKSSEAPKDSLSIDAFATIDLADAAILQTAPLVTE